MGTDGDVGVSRGQRVLTGRDGGGGRKVPRLATELVARQYRLIRGPNAG